MPSTTVLCVQYIASTAQRRTRTASIPPPLFLLALARYYVADIAMRPREKRRQRESERERETETEEKLGQELGSPKERRRISS